MKLFRKSTFLLCILPLVITSNVSGHDPEEAIARMEGELLNIKRSCRKSQARMSEQVGALRKELITMQGQLKSLSTALVDSQQKTVTAQNEAKTCGDKLSKATDKNNAKPGKPVFVAGQFQAKPADMAVFKDVHVTPKKTPKSTGPDLRGSPHYSDGRAGNAKADQAVSPLSFPNAPSNTDWLYAHLDRQIGLLKQLYSSQALRSLGTQEHDFCKVTKTRPYCIMQLRLYWISNAL